MITHTKPGGEKKKRPAGSHDGVVTAVSGNELTTTSAKGETHILTIAKDARITCEGKAATVADVTVGANVRITTQDDDKGVAVRVSCSTVAPPAKVVKA